VEVAAYESRVTETIASIPLFVIPVVPLSVVPTHGMRPLAALAPRASDIDGLLDSLLPGLNDELHFPARLAIYFGAPERVVENPCEILVAGETDIGVFAVEVTRFCGCVISLVFDQVSSLLPRVAMLRHPSACR
jgi:hypothetical protein